MSGQARNSSLDNGVNLSDHCAETSYWWAYLKINLRQIKRQDKQPDADTMFPETGCRTTYHKWGKSANATTCREKWIAICLGYTARFASHAFAEAGQGAGLFLVAALPEPALYGPHVPVELLGQALQPLLIWMLGDERRETHTHFAHQREMWRYVLVRWNTSTTERIHSYYLGYSSKNLLQDGVGLCFLWPVGLNLQAHGTRSSDKPERDIKNRIKSDGFINRGLDTNHLIG